MIVVQSLGTQKRLVLEDYFGNIVINFLKCTTLTKMLKSIATNWLHIPPPPDQKNVPQEKRKEKK